VDAIRVGIVGYGYWGPNIARNFSELSNSKVVAIADLKEEQRNPSSNPLRDCQGLPGTGLACAG
jgi:predicted dehydrogenase